MLETKLKPNMKKETEKIRKYEKKTRRIGNCLEFYSRSKTGRRKLIVEVWIRKIKGAKCGKIETERRKIY